MIYKRALICTTKNLFSSSTEIGTLSGFSNTTPRQFEEGKWYVGLSGNNYYAPNNIVEYEFTENYVYMNTKGSGYGVGKAFKCEANQTYTVSCKWVKYTNNMNIAIGFFDENGNYLFYIGAGYLAKKLTITTPDNCKWFTVCFVGSTGTVYIYNIQLEKGSTPTSYVPYGYLQSYKKAIKVSDICQLANANLFTPLGSDTSNYAGITVTKNIEAGTITFNGTSTSYFWYHVHDFSSELKYTNIIKGYKYYISGMPVNDLGVVFQLTSLYNLQGEKIFTAPKTSDGGAFNVYVPKGVTLTDFVVTPQLFNLTEMYGKGYEPTTVEEFKGRWYKNLFNKDAESQKGYYTESGSFVPYPAFNCFTIDITENTEYCRSTSRQGASKGIITFWNNDTFVSSINKGEYTKITFTTPGGVNKLKIVVEAKYLDSDIQLEKGSTATSYVPYTPNPAPYRPYCFVDSRKKAVKVSNIMQVISKPINGAGTELAGTTQELYGITCNFLADGTGVTLTGTATYTSIFDYFTFWKPVSGHKYLWLYGRENRGESTAYFEIKWTDKNGVGHWFAGEEQIYTLSPTVAEGYATRIDFHLIVPAGQTCNGFTWHPQCFDLTEMYGSGNEPTTVDEFKTKFPNDYYAYKPYSFI